MTTTTARTTRKGFTLSEAWREFWKHPSPWMIGVTLVAALTGRIIIGDWQITDALVPAVMLAVFPFFEWIVHVFILHWRPRHIGALTIDPLLAREHRKHHVNPRRHSAHLHTGQGPGVGAAARRCHCAAGIPSTWAGSYLPRVRYRALACLRVDPLSHPQRLQAEIQCYKAIWRNHRQHHFKNEHFWYTVTSSGTADRVLGTYPDPAAVPNLADREKPSLERGLAARTPLI